MTAESETFCVATFHSTYSVLKAEKILKESGLRQVRLIPVPSRISSDCGVTVRFLTSELERAHDLLEPLRDDLEGIYVQTGRAWKALYEGAE